MDPAPGALVAEIRPPCASTIFAAIASPSPVPFSFVVKNGEKI
jgi:hypothetical protein